MAEPLRKPKCVKIRLKSSLDVHGIGCQSLKQCITKACNVFKINSAKDVARILHDDTLVEDEEYFWSLPPQALLIFETKSDAGSMLNKVMADLKRLPANGMTSEVLLNSVRGIPADVHTSLIVGIAEGIAGNIDAETLEEDPDWFKNVANRALKTKSRVMEESAKQRITSYYYEAQKNIDKADLTDVQRQRAKKVLERWKADLVKNNYNKFYFSRTNISNGTFCCPQGWFICEGDYQSSHCSSLHRINPYKSKDERVLFSTWNLDHRIEKARTVLPKVIEMLKDEGHSYAGASWEYLYCMMFTRDNLKLVDIRCHDKREHSDAKLDDRKLKRRKISSRK